MLVRTIGTVSLTLSLTLSTLALAGPLEDARALIDAQRFDEARAVLEPAAADPALEAGAATLLAEAANDQGDWETGLRWGKRAIEANPESSAAQLQYAVALRLKMQNVSKIRAMTSLGDYKKSLERAIELDGNNISARLEQIGFYLNAPGIAGGSVEKAREQATALREIDWRRGTLELAQVETTSENPAAASALYRELLARDPEDHGARFRLGYSLQLEQRWADADAEFARLTALEGSTGANALYQRARTRILGEYEQEQAIAFLHEYLARADADAQPAPTSVWWRIGNAHEQLDQVDEARAAYDEALRLDPDNEQAKKARAALRKR